MEKLFDISLQNRKALYAILSKTPEDKLLNVPQGFRNNIWWNIVHVVVTQQLLVYGRSGLPMLVEDDLVSKYRKGTVPEADFSTEELDKVKSLLFSTLETTQQDYQNNRFKNYSAYTTSNKVEIKNVEDALSFNAFHEGLHLGAIISLLKVV